MRRNSSWRNSSRSTRSARSSTVATTGSETKADPSGLPRRLWREARYNHAVMPAPAFPPAQQTGSRRISRSACGLGADPGLRCPRNGPAGKARAARPAARVHCHWRGVAPRWKVARVGSASPDTATGGARLVFDDDAGGAPCCQAPAGSGAWRPSLEVPSHVPPSRQPGWRAPPLALAAVRPCHSLHAPNRCPPRTRPGGHHRHRPGPAKPTPSRTRPC